VRIQSSRSAQHGFWLDTKKWLQSRRGFSQFLLAAVVGFALAGVIGVGYKLGGWKIIEPPIRALFTEAENTTKALETNGLPTLYFDIGFEEYQTMAAQRDEALEKGILLLDDDDWMQAQIRFQDEAIPVRIRLKGDWTDHLGENKWSFRVKTRGDAVLMGMRSFSVQSPHTRGFLYEWLYLEDLRRADILAPRYSFVNVFVNGDDWGVYALEESFSKELLESLERREGVIVRFDESLFWRRRALFGGMDEQWKLYVDPIATTFESPEFAEVDEFDTNRVQDDPILREQSVTALGLLRGFQSEQLPPSQVFDAELMGRYLAHTNLWGARHSLAWHNERYYYNPLTSRLEPIAYDALPLEPRFAHFTDLAQYDDLAMMEAYAQETMRISQPEYLEDILAAYTDEFDLYYAALAQEFPEQALQPPWDVLAERQSMLLSALHPPQTVYAYQSYDGQGATVDVQVGNILRYPVVLRQVQIGDRAADVQPDWISESNRALFHSTAEPAVVLRRAQGTVPKYGMLHIPVSVIEGLILSDTLIHSSTLQIVTSLYGVSDQVIVDVQQDYAPTLSSRALPVQPSVEIALERYPFLTLSDQPGFLELKPGSWQVEGDLVLPDGFGLWATQSVSVTFGQDAIFFSNGPLLLRGPSEGGIYLGPQGDYWAGLIVLQADESLPSRLHNVEIRATTGINRDGWTTTGGVTFYESPVVLSNSRLLDSIAEDAINVVRSTFEFMHTEFGNIASDAFDGDFAYGRVEHCGFHDIRGDGIDVSGSTIVVKDVNLLQIHDKGISAGESSLVDVSNVHATNVGIAIASKDLSLVTAQEVYIERAWTAGLAAYVKKMEYGPARIEASHVVFKDDSLQTLVQIGSSVIVNDEPATVTELDVDELYGKLESLSKMQLLNYRLGSVIRLVGYELIAPELNLADELLLTLYWQADDQPEQNYTVFVHILNDSGELVAQQDGMPRDNTYATTHWTVGPLIDDTHTVSLPPDLPAGEYRLIIGMYVWQTGERLPAYRPNGEQVPEGAILLNEVLDMGG
jgi:hypothetical protein